MPLSSTSRPAIRGRVLIRLPATLQASGGLQVVKTNGVWTFSPDWTVLALETTIPEPESRQVWTYNPDTGVYTRITVQALIDNLPTGPQGQMAGFVQAFDSATADADPGDGEFRLNHATLASVTAAYLDNLDADGATVSGIIDTFDDSTNTSKGRIRFAKTTDPAIFAEYTVTGSVVDGTGYRKLTLTHIASAGTFVAGVEFSVAFFATGNVGATGPSTAGKQTIWIPATAMIPRTTNGAAIGTVEMTTNKNMVKTLDFDATTQEFAQFNIRMPKSWNEGTVTFVPVWSHAATVTNFGVVWGLDAVAISDDDTLDVAFGTEQTSADTGGTTNDLYHGPESSAITIAGTPTTNDLVQYRIHRNPAHASDTMAVDARLHGVTVHYTTDAETDA